MPVRSVPKPSPVTLDSLVDQTPASRDRFVDFLRAASICVVVLWHWTLSVTHRTPTERLTMPNPIGDVPLLWLVTWVLQVMPLFFVVGGYANFASWMSKRRSGMSARTYVWSRIVRLGRPTAVFLGTWAIASTALHTNVLSWGLVLFVPLWFVGAYGMVCALTPLTVRWFERSPLASTLTLLASVAAIDFGRLVGGIEWLRWPLIVATWTFCHQLGYFWRAAATDSTRTRDLRNVMMLGGVIGMLLCIHGFRYDHSLVAVRGAGRSNMATPSLPIASAAMLQLGLALVVAPAVRRRLQAGRAWKAVVVANSVAMTVLVWHMTAYLLALLVFERFGGQLGDQPTGAWWAARPLWIVGPALFLVPIVAVFRRFEKL
jgi:hypothetical protein